MLKYKWCNKLKIFGMLFEKANILILQIYTPKYVHLSSIVLV